MKNCKQTWWLIDWRPLIHSLTRTHTHTHTFTHSFKHKRTSSNCDQTRSRHTHVLSYSHAHTLSLTHTQIHSLSHTHKYTLSRTYKHTCTLNYPHSISLSLSHTHTLSLTLEHEFIHTLWVTLTHSLSLSLSYTQTIQLDLTKLMFLRELVFCSDWNRCPSDFWAKQENKIKKIISSKRRLRWKQSKQKYILYFENLFEDIICWIRVNSVVFRW
jgi:hypothetical protein